MSIGKVKEKKERIDLSLECFGKKLTLMIQMSMQPSESDKKKK
jgi:hypothetical protein